MINVDAQHVNEVATELDQAAERFYARAEEFEIGSPEYRKWGRVANALSTAAYTIIFGPRISPP